MSSSSIAEIPLGSVILVSTFAVAALYIVAQYTVATWTTATIILLVSCFALWKFKILPHVAFLFPMLLVALMAAIAADVGFRYYDGDNEVPGASIVAVGSVGLVAIGFLRGWF